MPRIRLPPRVRTAVPLSCARSRRVWRRLDHRNKHWIFNVFLGVAIELLLGMARHAPIVVAAQNWALDTAMRASAQFHAANGGDVPALAFVDIDEATWRDPAWGHGEPFRAPRDGLRKLIAYAIKQDARYIVVDVIVDGMRDPEDPEDKGFAADIETFAARKDDGAVHLKSDQHILFVRSLRQPLSGMEDLLAPEIRASPLDPVLERHRDRLHAVAPYFRVSRDGVLRDWQMWQVACRRDAETDTGPAVGSGTGSGAGPIMGSGTGHWEILPSVQLAVGALLVSHAHEDQGKPDADRTPFPWKERAATGRCPLTLDADSLLGVPVSKLRPSEAAIEEWVRRDSGLKHADGLEPPSGEAAEALTDRIFFQSGYRQELSGVTLIPALSILEDSYPGHLAKHAVVVIGQSFEAARDQHATPLGVMPGAMVLINSLNSVLVFGFLHQPAPVTEFAIALVLIVFVGWLFAYSDHIFIILGIFLFIPLLLFVNYNLAYYLGIWIDYAIPLLGICLHWIYVEIETYPLRRRERRGKHGHAKHTSAQHTGEKGGV